MDRTARTAARPGRRGFTLLEILVVVILVGILASVSFQSFGNARDRSANAKMDGNVHQIQQALLVFESDTERFPHFVAYPATPDGTKIYLTTPGGNTHYLPGDKLPSVPWTENWQNNNVNQTMSDLPGTDKTAGFYRVADLNTNGNTGSLPAAPTPLGSGVMPAQPGSGGPAGATFMPTTYGCILYDVNAARSLYTLHAVGKNRGNAVVVAVVTNAR